MTGYCERTNYYYNYGGSIAEILVSGKNRTCKPGGGGAFSGPNNHFRKAHSNYDFFSKLQLQP